MWMSEEWKYLHLHFFFFIKSMVVSRLNWWQFSAFCCPSLFPTPFFLFTSRIEPRSSIDSCCQLVRVLQSGDGCTPVMNKVITSLHLSSKNYVWFGKLWMKDALSSAKQFSLPQTKLKPLAFHVSLGPLLLAISPWQSSHSKHWHSGSPAIFRSYYQSLRWWIFY